MAADDDNQQDQNGNDEDAGTQPGISFADLAKLGLTILVTLIVFAGLVRGCASCQKKNPFTGEPTRHLPPAPGQ